MQADSGNDVLAAVMKTAAVWAMAIASMPLERWVQLAVLAYTALQIYVLARDKIVRPLLSRKRTDPE